MPISECQLYKLIKMLVKGVDDQGLNRHKKVPNCLGQIMTGIQIIIAYIHTRDCTKKHF